MSITNGRNKNKVEERKRVDLQKMHWKQNVTVFNEEEDWFSPFVSVVKKDKSYKIFLY